MQSIIDLVGNMPISYLAGFAGLELEEVVARVIGAQPSECSGPSTSKDDGGISLDPVSSGDTSRLRQTRTKEGRDSLDMDIFAFLQGQDAPQLGRDIRTAVGGDQAQIRARCNSMIADGTLEYEGKASATRYLLPQ